MHKRHPLNTAQIMRRAEALIEASSNRYRITVQVANRAKQRRYNEEDYDDSGIKSVLQAIVEMSDEMLQPEIIDDSTL
jgi:DNA-directed RNA polymerase subunit omega